MANIKVDWTNNSTTATGFNVYWSTTNSKPLIPNVSLGVVETYTITDLLDGIEYFIWVEAKIGSNLSAYITGSITTISPLVFWDKMESLANLNTPEIGVGASSVYTSVPLSYVSAKFNLGIKIPNAPPSDILKFSIGDMIKGSMSAWAFYDKGVISYQGVAESLGFALTDSSNNICTFYKFSGDSITHVDSLPVLFAKGILGNVPTVNETDIGSNVDFSVLRHFGITWKVGEPLKLYIDNVLKYQTTYLLDFTPNAIYHQNYMITLYQSCPLNLGIFDNIKVYNTVLTDFQHDIDNEGV